MAESYVFDMPEGTKLGDFQSWNKQHGYVQTEASRCDKEALQAAYNAAGRPAMRTWVKEQAGKGVALPSYPTCMAWFKKDGDTPASTASISPASSTGISLEAEFNQAFEQQRKTQYLTFLESKRADLVAQLASVDQEIRNLKTAMGITDPIVEE